MKFWTDARKAEAIAEIQLGIAMAKSSGVTIGRVGPIKFIEGRKNG